MKTKISKYAKNIIEENQNLHIIAFNDNQVLAMDKKTDKVYFFYTNGSMNFCFNLLGEVAEPYLKWFNFMIEKLNFQIETKETETDYFEILIDKYKK